ncbi:hypothetical protein CLA01_15780 [Chryseobacterium lathyri]|uniref:Uncharacterized protein n=1 Tax=Chryseobacterium lathyri TaxID=395933 RepID=A0A511Y8I1_9FLAO|nr:hypothetical protein CLA01_15780 [Chryseobacterium lathyri]
MVYYCGSGITLQQFFPGGLYPEDSITESILRWSGLGIGQLLAYTAGIQFSYFSDQLLFYNSTRPAFRYPGHGK